MSRIDQRGVRQTSQFVERMIQHLCQFIGGHSDRSHQVRSTHVADKQRVAGEYRVWNDGTGCEIKHQQ